jgi:transglutaminase-like putative cysteine protease
MARLARAAASDPGFRGFVRGLGTLGGIEDFVRRHFAYRDENEEIVREPRFMLADMGRVDENGRVVQLEGDCDDVATFYAAAAVAIGKAARFVAIRYTITNPNFEHVFTEAYDNGQWHVLDATVPAGTPMRWIESMIEDV